MKLFFQFLFCPICIFLRGVSFVVVVVVVFLVVGGEVYILGMHGFDAPFSFVCACEQVIGVCHVHVRY